MQSIVLNYILVLKTELTMLMNLITAEARGTISKQVQILIKPFCVTTNHVAVI